MFHSERPSFLFSPDEPESPNASKTPSHDVLRPPAEPTLEQFQHAITERAKFEVFNQLPLNLQKILITFSFFSTSIQAQYIASHCRHKNIPFPATIEQGVSLGFFTLEPATVNGDLYLMAPAIREFIIGPFEAIHYARKNLESLAIPELVQFAALEYGQQSPIWSSLPLEFRRVAIAAYGIANPVSQEVLRERSEIDGLDPDERQLKSGLSPFLTAVKMALIRGYLLADEDPTTGQRSYSLPPALHIFFDERKRRAIG